MTPQEQWLKPYERRGLLSSEQQQKLAELRTAYHHLTEALIAQLPAGHAKTEALTGLQASALWAAQAIEVYDDP